jgi:uncharacterized protein YdcH (DUF465 family)
MASDPFEDPKYMALVHEVEDIDDQIYKLGEQRRHLLNQLEAMEA